jgi:uncharacterized protein DUF4038/uncharacterized protein DUF5060
MTPAAAASTSPSAPQWQEIELVFELPSAVANPYTDVDVWVDFVHSDGEVLTRPAFWDGGDTWRCRFSSTQPSGTWHWLPHASIKESELLPELGTLQAAPAAAETARGLLRLAPGGRTLVHSDGTPALLVADTAWAMPWRATVEDVERYASDRQQKGFNAVLLMTVQPDMGASGPRGRNIDYGFEVGFEDLPSGHLNQLSVGYFQYFDQIVSILHQHDITPILQPVFHGFGWKGLGVAGPVVPPEEYARYCRYLVARYGARPLLYLVGADGSGTEPQVETGGIEVHRWDAYSQPTGIHYQPHSTADAHQAADWLDFQSCQTGHQGDHVPDRVANLWRNEPHKAVMNGEPTYEQTVRRGNGAGWWQGHEAWSNLCAGGTMGVAYGAGSLWQWRVRADEPGFHTYFLAEGAGWQEALQFEGSRYVGLVGKILAGLPTSNLQPSWDLCLCTRGLVDPGVLFIGYAEHGGRWDIRDTKGHVPSPYWLIDPRTGAVLSSGRLGPGGGAIEDDSTDPRVLICCDTPPRIAAS